jgi:hypothetical protein
MDDGEPLRVRDSSNLTDGDWTEIERWQQAYCQGGIAKLYQVMDRLAARNSACHVRLVEAFWPETVRQTIWDQFLQAGMREDDVADLMRKLEQRLGVAVRINGKGRPYIGSA